MITTTRQALLRLYLSLALLAVVATALPPQDASTNVGSPFLLTGQTLSSNEETAVGVQDGHQVIPRVPNQPDDETRPFLDVDDLSAEYEHVYEDDESVDVDDDERVRRSLMGRGSTARGGRRGGGGDVSRRRGQHRYDYDGGSPYTYSAKRAPIPAPAITDSSSSSPSTTTTTTSNTKSKKEKKKKKKSGTKNRERNGLTKELRQEIAQYALVHGLVAANEAYKGKVGRLIPEKVIDKWVQRLRKKQNKYAS